VIGTKKFCQNSASGQNNIIPHLLMRSVPVLSTLPVYVNFQEKLRTSLGYRTFYCRDCERRFNERYGTPLNDLQFPNDIVLLAALWRLRYKLGFRDVAELLLHQGQWSMAISLQSHRSRWKPTRFDAELTPGQTCSSKFLEASAR
jgi:hypothetical protein